MISKDVDAALRAGAAKAFMHSANPTEPELVAGVFSAGLPDLASSLATTDPAARIAGVFCHSRPMATKIADASWKCEVGDLLVVSRYDNGSTVERRALLLQVKKPPIKFATSGTPARQVELYAYWPVVNVFGTPHDVDPSPHRGAQFSFWENCAAADAGCTGCRWDERIPGDPLTAALADELADVVTGIGGRSFVDYAGLASTGDDWSGLIWDLLRQSLNQAWSVASKAQKGKSRTWDDGVFLTTSSPDIPALLVGTELEGIARELWSAPGTEPAAREGTDGQSPPLNPDLPPRPEASDEGGLPIIFTEAGPRDNRD
jgi:hypothetical protein